MPELGGRSGLCTGKFIGQGQEAGAKGTLAMSPWGLSIWEGLPAAAAPIVTIKIGATRTQPFPSQPAGAEPHNFVPHSLWGHLPQTLPERRAEEGPGPLVSLLSASEPLGSSVALGPLPPHRSMPSWNSPAAIQSVPFSRSPGESSERKAPWWDSSWASEDSLMRRSATFVECGCESSPAS